MTQHYLGQIPDPSQESGNDLSNRLNSFDNGHRTNQSGPTRPAGILAGGVWTRVINGVYDLMLFDGAQDRVVMRGDQNLSGLTDLEAARDNIGLGKLATKDKAHIVNETTGTLSVARGGTGGGTQAAARTGLGLGDGVTYDRATEAEARNGSSNVRLMTPLRVAQAIDELALGGGTRYWRDVKASRSFSTVYSNTTGHFVYVFIDAVANTESVVVQVRRTSSDSWVTVGQIGKFGDWRASCLVLVPPGADYWVNGTSRETRTWSEFR